MLSSLPLNLPEEMWWALVSKGLASNNSSDMK